MRFVLGVQNRRGEETEVRDGARNIESACERDRFAGVDRFRARELFQIALDQIRDAQKELRSLGRGFFRPVKKRLLSRGYGKIDILFSAIGDLRVGLSGSRLDVVEKFAALRLAEFAVDEIFDSWELFLHAA